MYIEWRINDEIKGISLEEFEKDYESFFGYMMLKLGNYHLGWMDNKSPIDEFYEEDISLYLISLIKCGITLMLGQDFKVKLSRSNLLEIQVHRKGKVYISIVHTDKNEVLYSYGIAFSELIDEIKENYQKYINEIQMINSELIEARVVRIAKEYYDIFIKLLNSPIDILI